MTGTRRYGGHGETTRRELDVDWQAEAFALERRALGEGVVAARIRLLRRAAVAWAHVEVEVGRQKRRVLDRLGARR